MTRRSCFCIFRSHAKISSPMNGPFSATVRLKQLLLISLLFCSILQVESQELADSLLDMEVYYAWDQQQNEWVPEDRFLYRYDNLTNTIEQTAFIWDLEKSTWEGSSQYQCGYDSLGYEVRQNFYFWDDQRGDWSPGGTICNNEGVNCQDLPAMIELERDTSGELTAQKTYLWDQAGQQYELFQDAFIVFDEEGRMDAIRALELDTLTNLWIETYHADYYYDSLGNNSAIERYAWDDESEALVESTRILFSNDTLGNPTEELYEVWDRELGAWNTANKIKRAFDTLGYEVLYALYEWKAELPGWGFIFRQEYAKDSLGKILEYLEYVPDQNTGKEIPNWRALLSYDSTGNLVEEISYYWNPRVAYWSKARRETMAYDTGGNNTGAKTYYWDNNTNDWSLDQGTEIIIQYNPQGEVIEETTREWDSGREVWYNVSKLEYYWINDLLREQSFAVDESDLDSASLGPIAFGRLYQDEKIILSFDSTGAEGRFVIDSLPQGYALRQNAPIDFEEKPVYTFSVIAHLEDGGEMEPDTAQFTIYVRNVNDNAPIVRDTVFYVEEGLVWRKTLGAVPCTDPDGDLNTLRYTVPKGDENRIFGISSLGFLIVEKYDSIDFEKRENYVLTVRVTDGLQYGEASVTVHVLDVDEPVSVAPVPKADFKLFPNPAGDVLRLEGPDSQYEVVITSPNGTLLYRAKFGGSTHVMDISSFSEGIYLISIRSDEQVVTRKIIKQ